MVESFLYALAASLLTFLIWFALIVLGFALVGFAFGWQLRRLLPENRDRLPRKVWVAACVGAALVFGALSGIEVGGMQAVLSLGDSLAVRSPVLVTPLTGLQTHGDGVTGAAVRLAHTLEYEISEMRGRGWILYGAARLLFSSWFDPMVMLGKLVRAHIEVGAGGSHSNLVETWMHARPDLEATALRKIAASVITGMLYLIGLVSLGVLALAASWKELRDGLSES